MIPSSYIQYLLVRCVIFTGLFTSKTLMKSDRLLYINVCVYSCVLCAHTAIVIVDVMCTCTSTYRFHLTTIALDELLKLIHSLLLQPNLWVKSVFTFKKFLSKLCPHTDSSRHPYCSVCLMPIENDIYCHGENNVEYFITTDFVGQLRSKFKGIQLCVKSYWVLTCDVHFDFVLCYRQKFLELA